MHPAIAQHRSGISAICQRYRICRLEVFGSAARGDDFKHTSSDADFLVEFAPDAQPGLETFFGAKAWIWSSPMPYETPVCWPASTATAKPSMQRDPRAFFLGRA
jgi:Nucleotidyltransferase domain